MKKIISTVLYIAGVIVLLISTCCAGNFFKNYGTIIPDSDATASFESYRLAADFNYYISGSDVYPNALMGLQKAFSLDSALWKKIEPTPQEFREIIQNMQKKALAIYQTPHGFAIFDDKGVRIGIWYSILSAKTAVQIKGNSKVMIFTPDLDTYQKYEKDGS